MKCLGIKENSDQTLDCTFPGLLSRPSISITALSSKVSTTTAVPLELTPWIYLARSWGTRKKSSRTREGKLYLSLHYCNTQLYKTKAVPVFQVLAVLTVTCFTA